MRPDNEQSPLDTFWIGALRDLTDQMDVIADQAEAASEAHPDLVRAFGLMLSLAGYLSNQAPDLAFTPEIDAFIEKLCARNPVVCQCVQGNAQYCKILDGPQKLRPPVEETCESLFKQYQEAMQREREAMRDLLMNAENPLVVWESKGLNEIGTAIRESDEIRSKMWRMGCVFPLSG